jgi:hypothetical protein
MKWTGGRRSMAGLLAVLLPPRHQRRLWPSVNPVCAQNGEPVSHCYSGRAGRLRGPGLRAHGFYGTIHSQLLRLLRNIVGDQQNGNNYDDTGIDLTAGLPHLRDALDLGTVSWYLDGKLLH